ncbi:MAG: hypothetical protein NTW68_14950 [candidate division NC10 bacterium]|nr:hypothetical protein [candidate division NC10 bacterium]
MRKQLECHSRDATRRHQCLCPRAVPYLGYPGVTEVGFLGVTTSAVNRAAWTDPTPKLVECR